MSKGDDIEKAKAERFKEAVPVRSAEMVAKHRARALEQLAAHRCVTDLTDGFCGGPRDGKCEHPKFSGTSYRNCVNQAEGLMRAMESRGCTVVWAFDPEMRGEA